MVGFRLDIILPADQVEMAMAVLTSVFETGAPAYYQYHHDGACIGLISMVDDDTVVVHEMQSDLMHHAHTKAFLRVAADNFLRTLYNKETG